MIVVADNPKPGLGVARLVCNATDILQLPAGLLDVEDKLERSTGVRLYDASAK